MQNVKRKNMYLEGFFLSKSYVLDRSESIDMRIEKGKKQFFLRCPQKNGFAVRRGGGGQKVTEMFETIRIFYPFHVRNY